MGAFQKCCDLCRMEKGLVVQSAGFQKLVVESLGAVRNWYVGKVEFEGEVILVEDPLDTAAE